MKIRMRPAFTTPILPSTALKPHPLPVCPASNPATLSKPPHRLHLHMSTTTNPGVTNFSPSTSPTTTTKVCTSLTASTISAQQSQLASAHATGADLAEIRIDLLHPSEQPNWSQLLSQRQLPVIVTNRASWEGGNATTDEQTRLSLLVQAVQQGAEFVDVELKAASLFTSACEQAGVDLRSSSTRLILSHHDFDRALSLPELQAIMQRMELAGADICKIAMMATSALDNATVFSALRQASCPSIILAMGEVGQLSRIAAGKYGAFLTFAALQSGQESAPGQVDLHSLLDLYRFREITPSTPLFGVIGNPVSHSMSPALHNAALAHMDMPGAYFALKVESQVVEFIRVMSQLGFQGFSVTIPGKVDAMQAMDELDSVAEQIGAMNTVVLRPDGSLKGYNTDWVAAISAVEEQVQGGLNGKHVLCIGAGGAGRALAFGALQRGAAHVTVANRTAAKAQALAKELGKMASGVGLESLGKGVEGKFHVVLNSTAVGMHPNVEDSPVEKEIFEEGMVVFDAVYNPLETRMLREAKEAGCITVSGLEMFVRQAAEQFRLWFPEVEPPMDRMRQVVMEKLGY